MIEEPTRAYLASLPTDTGALRTYLRSHVEGSSSLDEAVFDTVGTALSTADGLASPRLRAAMVAVLSRTAGVHVWHDQRDQLGRPAIRLDFVNQKIRPGEVDSMYFDPTDFRLLGHSISNGQSTRYDGPSPAYDSPAPANGDDPETTEPLGIELMTTESVITTLPSSLRHCPNG